MAAGGLVEEARTLVAAAAERQRQLDMLDPVSPEDMARAQEELGANAGPIAVLDHARAARRGRRPGSRNRRTKDFENYIRQFGRDPAITLMEIQSTQPEMLVARSKQLDPVKRQMTIGEAQALRVRCAEALMPYLHGKKPLQVDLTATGDFNLLIPGVNVSEEDAKRAAAGEFVVEGEYLELDDGGEGGE